MIGFVVGMQSEARLLSGGRVVCSGGIPVTARRLADQLLREGAAGLVSFGIAGGLDARLSTGTLVVGSAVAANGEAIPAEVDWCRRLSQALPSAVSGIICGAEAVAATAAAKQALQRQSGGLVVDLESGAVAEACRLAGKPFAVLRAVADPAGRAVPTLAMAGLGPDGRTRPWAVAGGLARRPWELPALIRLGVETGAALRALSAAAGLLGPALGFDLL